MKAGEVMTRHVVSIAPDATIRDAAQLMWRHGISGLPVVDKAGKLVGMITEGDLLRRAETGTERHRSRWLELLAGRAQQAAEYVRSHGRRVDEVMTSDPVVITEDTSLDEVVSLMERRRIKRVPVVSGLRIIGIVSRANLLHALASLARRPAAEHQDDTTIRKRIIDELERQAWARGTNINVVVYNGDVELWGEVEDEEQVAAVRVLVENVLGVSSIRNHLTLPEITVT